jgi:uncharacterized membrane protein
MSDSLHNIVGRNIGALIDQQKQEDERRPRAEKIADAITRFTGSMRFVYLHLALFGTWILVNVGVFAFIPRFDPYPFVMLAMFASVEAIFLSTFVLITQNRMAALADRRADLDLHVNLLAEHEITRVIHLLDAVARHLGVEPEAPEELDELKRDVRPEQVLETIQRHRDDAETPAGKP